MQVCAHASGYVFFPLDPVCQAECAQLIVSQQAGLDVLPPGPLVSPDSAAAGNNVSFGFVFGLCGHVTAMAKWLRHERERELNGTWSREEVLRRGR